MNKKDPNIPPGWDYNPASWPQRWPIIILALVGFCIATYLTLFQINVIETIWEPFFGNGSVKVLTSATSKILPIPDAALGAMGYLADAVAGAIGGVKRWRKMPWIVVAFGFAVGPLGITSLLLVVLQPVKYDTWCTLCLASAFISVVMIGPAMDELLASLQYLKRVKKAGMSAWKGFWGYKSVTDKVA
jgi:uncharacterized membrane protein